MFEAEPDACKVSRYLVHHRAHIVLSEQQTFFEYPGCQVHAVASVGANEPMGVRPAIGHPVCTAEIAATGDGHEDVPGIDDCVYGGDSARLGNTVGTKQGAVEIRSDQLLSHPLVSSRARRLRRGEIWWCRSWIDSQCTFDARPLHEPDHRWQISAQPGALGVSRSSDCAGIGSQR